MGIASGAPGPYLRSQPSFIDYFKQDIKFRKNLYVRSSACVKTLNWPKHLNNMNTAMLSPYPLV